MNLWRWCAALFVLLGATCLLTAPGLHQPVGAQGKDKKEDEKKADKKEEKAAQKDEGGQGVTLKFTAFDPDSKPFYQLLETKTKQTMKVMGQEIVQVQDQTFVVKWTPQKKDDKGNYKVEQNIVGVKMNIDIGGNKISYDSTQKNPKNPMTDFFDQLLKQKLTFHISPKLEVTEVEGRDEFIKSLGETNPQMTTLLKTILSQEALTKMAEPTWWALPDGSVAKGKTWTKESDLKLGPIGSYHTVFHFSFEGPEGKDKHKIGIKTDLAYTTPSEKESAGLPFVIKEGKLASKSSSGEAIFDQGKGRFESSKMDMKLEGTLTIAVGNMNTEITLNQDQNSNSRTSDSDPWAGAGAGAAGEKK